MLEKFPTNPFLLTPQDTRRPQRPSVFETRPRSSQTYQERAIEQRFRDRQHAAYEPDPDRLPSVMDLYEHLKQGNHAQDCESVFSCDPWKYEPHLYQDLGLLLAERANEEDEGKRTALDGRIRHLRGLIRAGSWMTYDRPDIERDLPKFRSALQAQIIGLERDARELDQQLSDVQLKNSDPAWIAELKTEQDRLLLLASHLRRLPELIQNGTLGNGLSEALAALDASYARLTLRFKEQAAAHGLSLEQASREYVLRHLRQEVESMRALRDLLYFRHLYPNLAKNSLKQKS